MQAGRGAFPLVPNGKDGGAREFLSGKGINVDEMAGHIDGKFMSAFARALKPKQCCCGS